VNPLLIRALCATSLFPIVNQLKPMDSKKVYFACAPERVNPGDAVWNQKNTPRLVGAIDQESKKALAFYKSICDAVVSVSTPEVAEAAKLLRKYFSPSKHCT
jgi:UDP-N-acetyl-D-glucosamine dehydrogenase